MSSFFKTHKIDVFFISLILVISLAVRILFLDIIPPNISGDEVTNLSFIYKILYSTQENPFSIMGDGSMAGVQFYFIAFIVYLLGPSHTIFALRLSIVIFSILSLVPFYLLLKTKTSQFISFLTTVLLSANYVFLNFSRTAWLNMGTICFGIWMFYFLEKGVQTKQKVFFIVAGIFAGFMLYGYQYGRLLFIFIIIYFLLSLLKKPNKNFLKNITLFFITTALLFIPFLLNTTKQSESFFARRNATYVFNKEKIHSTDQFREVLIHQVTYTIKGLILFDPSVMSDGVENQRYTPFHTAEVNILIQICFILGILYLFVKKIVIPFWWCVAISTFLVVSITELPPNFSRALFYIPFIYFISGFFLHVLQIKLKKLSKLQFIILIALSLLIFIFDISTYFKWMNTQELYNARQPAIDYSEFKKWQEFQIERVKTNLEPVTNYEWYEIRKTLE